MVASDTPTPQGTIFRVGDLLNNTYRIEAVLGRGGTSEVYRATSEVSGSRVAIKVLRSELSDNEAFVTLMAREEAIRKIRHDAIVPYFHADRTDDGRVFLVMDYVEGTRLDHTMRAGGMSAEALLSIAEKVAEGLQAAHGRNVVHRDLSPDNIILRNEDPADAVIIDFGIAKDTNPGAETVVGNSFAGKYAYAAPEQLNGQTDHRSDIYALGAVLLAAFRGKSPSDGLSPMEIVRRKGDELDTEGVPEPLRGLIKAMTEPDPARRLQDAGAVLRHIRAGRAASAQPDETVIAPRTTAKPEVPHQAGRPARASPAPKPEAARATAAPARRRGGLGALVLALALLAGAGLIWWAGLLDGVLGPRLPMAEPFTLVVERAEGAAPHASGNVPSEAVQAALAQRVAEAGGAADLTLARGNIADGWGDGILALVDELAPLDEWRLATSDSAVTITGTTGDAALRDRLALSLPQRAQPAGLAAQVDIALREQIVAPAQIQGILDAAADCGPLTLVDPPPVAYPPGAAIVIGGRIAEPSTEVAIAEAIAGIAGSREVRFQNEILNPTLCLIDAALPQVPPGGFGAAFSEGQSGEARPTGAFLVGDNPVIDVTIPADVTDGYLNVIVIDVSGNVYHLLPNTYVPDNAVAALRGGQSGPVVVRLSHPLADAQGGGRLAFTVDDTALGQSQVLVLHSAAPILDGQRPMTESAASFAEALSELDEPVRTLDRWTITTSEP